jgi:hypothetical protein
MVDVFSSITASTGDVAEHRDLVAHLGRDRLLGAADEDVGLDADLAELADASAVSAWS